MEHPVWDAGFHEQLSESDLVSPLHSAVLLQAILLGTAALVAISGCAAPSHPPDGASAAGLEPCGQVDVSDGLPIDGSPPLLFKFCMQIALHDSVGNEKSIQVMLVSDQKQDPLKDRRLLVYHPGGPGVPPSAILSRDPPLVDYAAYAVVTWDGTTASTDRGSCGPASTEFGTSRNAANLAASAEATATECRFGYGTDADIGAVAAAAELDLVRSALGQENVDMLMISYGTAIGEAYLRLYPSRVARAVLDAPIALEVPWSKRLSWVDLALRNESSNLVAECSKSSCAALASRDVPLTYLQVRQAVLDTRPVVGSGSLSLTAVMLDQATEAALRSVDYWDAYAQAVGDGLAGDGTALWAMGESLYFDLDRSVFYRSVCADIDRPSDVTGYVVPADGLIAAYASELAPCAWFPHHGVPAIADAPDRPDVLLVTSTRDILAPANLLLAAPDLVGMSSTCQTDVAGHTSFRDPDVGGLISRFFRDGDSGAIAENCASTFR